MATGHRLPPLLILLLLAAAATTASARPCKTLFYFSATTTTTYYPNPNPNPRYLTLIFTTSTTTTTTTRFPRPSLNFISSDPSTDSDSSDVASSSASILPLNLYPSAVSSSIRDRTKDIMSVVGALLFGVGCGALTAATMYFVWALFSPRRFDLDDGSSSSSDDDDDDDRYEDDVAAAKRKLGYVAVPADPKEAEAVPVVAKEVV